MTNSDAEKMVEKFFNAVIAGELADSMLTDDMTAWTTLQGTMDKAAYQQAIRLLKKISKKPLDYTIDAITAQDDRIVVEARSDGQLVNGDAYKNTYVFVLRVRNGLIASVAEHFNALVVMEKMVPLIRSGKYN